jgi:hypothetical protein
MVENSDLSFDNMSSTDSSDFIRGLRDIGLASDPPSPREKGDAPRKPDPPIKQTVKKAIPSAKPVKHESFISGPVIEPVIQAPRREKSPTDTSKDASRRRPTKIEPGTARKLLTFVDLMSDTSPDPPPRITIDSFTDASSLETRISAYFSTALRAALVNVQSEIMAMLDGSENVHEIASDFLSTFRSELRQAINFHQDQFNYSINSLETHCADFRSAMRDAHKFHHFAAPGRVDSIRLSRGLVNGYRRAQEQSLDPDISDFTHEIRSLRKAKTRAFRQEIIGEQQISKSRRDLVDLEVKEIWCKAEIQLMEAQRDRLDSLPDHFSQELNIMNPLRETVATLQLMGLEPTFSRPIGNDYSLQARKTLEEIQELRISHSNHQALLWRNLATLKAMETVIPVQIEQSVATLAKPAEAAVSGTEISIADIRSKLDMIQLERDRNLENISLFLENARHKSRHFHGHRTRRHRS